MTCDLPAVQRVASGQTQTTEFTDGMLHYLLIHHSKKQEPPQTQSSGWSMFREFIPIKVEYPGACSGAVHSFLLSIRIPFPFPRTNHSTTLFRFVVVGLPS